MRVVKTTEANADSLRAVVDQAYGYPSRPATMLSGLPLHPSVPRAWDGAGPVPFGCTKTQCEVYVAGPADAWLALDDATAARVASSAVSAGDKARIAAADRQEEPDPSQGGTRIPKANAAEKAAKETKS